MHPASTIVAVRSEDQAGAWEGQAPLSEGPPKTDFSNWSRRHRGPGSGIRLPQLFTSESFVEIQKNGRQREPAVFPTCPHEFAELFPFLGIRGATEAQFEGKLNTSIDGLPVRSNAPRKGLGALVKNGIIQGDEGLARRVGDRAFREADLSRWSVEGCERRVEQHTFPIGVD